MHDLLDGLKYFNSLLKEYECKENETMMKKSLVNIIKKSKEIKEKSKKCWNG